MKRIANPGALVFYEGRLATVVGIAEGRTLTLEFATPEVCSQCGHRARVHVLEHSRLFQDLAEPVETLVGD